MRAIDHVIDKRAVHPVFQPLVDLTAGGVLGYEALSRGPAGSPWESPAELFAAARRAGREVELDWVCQAQAFRRILAAGADPALTWFVNVEPASAGTVCPPDLADVVDQARTSLRVVLELAERAVARDPGRVPAVQARSREAGWGVALDDVGTGPDTIALLPVVRPDVVKLDLQLLHAPDDPPTAAVVAAVADYAEATAAIVLAEGIETARHLATARAMGATVGQGWHFGRPGSLPRGRRAQARLPLIVAR
jgi:EAL domain-containing protein (putative c-di-GMP-specific phosphodiesterase class I)